MPTAARFGRYRTRPQRHGSSHDPNEVQGLIQALKHCSLPHSAWHRQKFDSAIFCSSNSKWLPRLKSIVSRVDVRFIVSRLRHPRAEQIQTLREAKRSVLLRKAATFECRMGRPGPDCHCRFNRPDSRLQATRGGSRPPIIWWIPPGVHRLPTWLVCCFLPRIRLFGILVAASTSSNTKAPRGSTARSKCGQAHSVRSTLVRLIDEAVGRIKEHVRERTVLHDLFFRERLEYPTSLAEGNRAVAHRDYGITGAAIEIWMFDDRIEVRSPGLPPPRPEQLRQHKSIHFSRTDRTCPSGSRLSEGNGRRHTERFSRRWSTTASVPEFSAEGFLSLSLCATHCL